MKQVTVHMPTFAVQFLAAIVSHFEVAAELLVGLGDETNTCDLVQIGRLLLAAKAALDFLQNVYSSSSLAVLQFLTSELAVAAPGRSLESI